MKKFWFCIAAITAFLLLASNLSSPVLAADSTIVETTFFGNIDDKGDGCGVFTILNTVVDILSIGVGVLGVIAISISGIQYLTSAGNEEQARKSRHRIFQIIIGLAVYAVMYAGINWLTPSGKLNTGSECSTITNAELAKKKAAKNPTSNNNGSTTNKPSSTSTNTSNSSNDPACLKNAIKIVKDAGICKAKTAAERIARTAELLAWPLGTSKTKYKNGPTNNYKKAIAETVTPTMPKNQRQYAWAKGRSCSVFVAAVVRASGYDKSLASSGNKFSVASINHDAKKSQKWKSVSPSKAARGDIFAYKDNHHVMIYGGKKGSKHIWYQADVGDYYGYASYGSDPKTKKNVNVWRATEK